MTDDEILDALDRRLSGVETRLPPTPVGVAGRALDGRSVRVGSLVRSGPMPAALAVVAVIVIALAVGSRLSVGVESDASPSSRASTVTPTLAPSFEPAMSALANPSPSAPNAGLEIVRGPTDGATVLASRMGWGPCLVQSFSYSTLPDATAIDAAIDEGGITEGFVELPSGSRFWIGASVESAALGAGSPLLAIGSGGDTWILQASRGRGLTSDMTPKGKTFWRLRGSVSDAQCPPGESPAGSRAPVMPVRPLVHLEVIHDPARDGFAAIVERTRWGPCGQGGDSLIVFPSGAEIDEAVDRTGVQEGFVAVGRSDRLWIGPTAESAARGYGASLLVIGRLSIAWILIPESLLERATAYQLATVSTPKGRTAWFVGGTFMTEAPCTGG